MLKLLPLVGLSSATIELKSQKEFDDFVKKSGKGSFIKFFAPWCGHCKKMKPDWDKMAEEYKDSANVGFADVDCTADGKDICSKVGVRGYPTIKYWVVDDDAVKDYKGGRSLGDLKKFTEDTFKPGCDVDTEANCSPEQKKIVKELKGKDKAAVEKKMKEVSEKLKKKEDDLKKHQDDSSKKTEEFNTEIKGLNTEFNMVKKMAKKVGAKGHDEL